MPVESNVGQSRGHGRLNACIPDGKKGQTESDFYFAGGFLARIAMRHDAETLQDLRDIAFIALLSGVPEAGFVVSWTVCHGFACFKGLRLLSFRTKESWHDV